MLKTSTQTAQNTAPARFHTPGEALSDCTLRYESGAMSGVHYLAELGDCTANTIRNAVDGAGLSVITWFRVAAALATRHADYTLFYVRLPRAVCIAPCTEAGGSADGSLLDEWKAITLAGAALFAAWDDDEVEALEAAVAMLNHAVIAIKREIATRYPDRFRL